MRALSSNSQNSGLRAEEVAAWYFRLNGFLQIPGFVLHSDDPGRPITDADLLAVRFPYSNEGICGAQMTDDRWISAAVPRNQILFLMVEVKSRRPRLNTPWTTPESGSMEKVVNRLGFLPEDMTSHIAKSLYDTLEWADGNFVVKYVTIGSKANKELATRYRGLHQLTWNDVAMFLWDRFKGFGYLKGSHPQWPRFGRLFARGIAAGPISSPQTAFEFVNKYITGDQKEQLEER